MHAIRTSLMSPRSLRVFAVGCAAASILAGLGANRLVAALISGEAVNEGPAGLSLSTGICLVALGAAVILGIARRRKAAATLASCVFVAGELGLLGTLVPLTKGLDELLAIGSGVVGFGDPGRMSAQMALCLIGGSVATLGMLQRARVSLSATAASLVGASGGMSALGYTVDLRLLYGWSGVGQLAVDVSLATSLLAVALLAALAAESFERRPGVLPDWLPVPVGVSTAFGGLILWHAATVELLERNVRPIGAGSLATLAVSGVAAVLVAAVARLWVVAEHRQLQLEDANRDLQRSYEELRIAAQEIKTLSGLIPMCAWCKSIRDDAGYWEELESYLKVHAHVLVTHGICPACLERESGAGSDAPPVFL